MENREILEAAISRAIDGGWFPVRVDKRVRNRRAYFSRHFCVDQRGSYSKETACEDCGTSEIELSVKDIIFNHDFAKALWGEKHSAHEGQFVDGAHGMRWTPDWQHHLQQMVIADDPIKYLGEHLDG